VVRRHGTTAPSRSEHGQRLGQRERPLVQRPADDDADDLLLTQLLEAAEVVQQRDAAAESVQLSVGGEIPHPEWHSERGAVARLPPVLVRKAY